MKVFETMFEFPFPFKETALGVFMKYPNPHAEHVISVDVIDRSILPDGTIRTERILGVKQSAPRWVMKIIGGQDETYVREVTFVTPGQAVRPPSVLMSSINLSLAGVITCRERIAYTPHSAASTRFRQIAQMQAQGSLDVDRGTWASIGKRIETWSRDRFALNAHAGREGLGRRLCSTPSMIVSQSHPDGASGKVDELSMTPMIVTMCRLDPMHAVDSFHAITLVEHYRRRTQAQAVLGLPRLTFRLIMSQTTALTTPSGKPIGPLPRKIALMGSRSVGKSSLVVQYVDNHFVESYYPTIENHFSKIIRYKGKEFALDIHDTAGQDEFSLMHTKHTVGPLGWVLVYSIASRASFNMLRVIRDKILDARGEETIPLVIVGNKLDLETQRQVPKEEARKLAQEWNCVFIETSAKDNDNVAKVFEDILIEIEKKINPAPEAKSSCAIM
ncbi:uncharacterized protein L969DRAFT_106098 [Mixia osmundae IAM 14324]|uniref:PRELI/MSF1 domain-containing protein n=1 Tax=Mixia osmundae (strain CBS 9802 / IAM 14324 / JCM 22182 / KY 12970) TaxID=764103 RepID=G7E4F9_MIXOS|nr:uncharacterized protein L969DRAFT_106098 [Mixia osmundae IAM 14324]KEI36264.1 hypothetical protein L969DRAFT_106098 [Mixia osmundae IAM 14324]GAA97719.1 hypothetical protein E5Q_04398 [Mixia osmundae IAM 14324]